MKIGIGKFGKTVYFGNVSSLRSVMTSGAIDGPRIFGSLVRKYPEHEFYMIGRSNFSRLSPEEKDAVAPAGNLIDPWSMFDDWRAKYGQDEFLDPTEFLDFWRRNSGVELDFGVFLPGNVFSISVVGKSILKTQDRVAKSLLATSNYTAPVFHYINQTTFPYLILLTDPRTWMMGRNEDLFRTPRVILSQMNEEIKTKHRHAYDDRATKVYSTSAVYSGVETLYLMEEEKKASLNNFFAEEQEEKERDIRVMVMLNEGDPSRLPEVKKYLHDVPDHGIVVYGKWKKELLDTGNFADVPMADMEDEMSRTRYTLCVPIKKGWATGKFWDMLRRGILPFVTADYDVQDNMRIPSFLKVSSGAEFRAKMDELDADPDKRETLLKQCEALVKPEYKDGTHIAETIMKHVIEEYERGDNQAPN